MGGFCQLVKLHQEGSALAAGAAGLFSFITSLGISLDQCPGDICQLSEQEYISQGDGGSSS